MLPFIKLIGLFALFASIVLGLQLALNVVLTRRAERAAINERLKLLKAGVPRESVVTLLRADRLGAPVVGNGTYARFCMLVGQANVPFPPATIFGYMATGTIGVFIALLILASTAGPGITGGVVLIVLTFSAAVGMGLPVMWLSRRAERRRKKMEEQFPTAVEIFTRALRAGHPISSALFLLTNEMEDPIGSEFGLVCDEVAYGADLGDSLASLSRRWDMPDLKMFSVCLAVQSETGGNLAEILSNLAGVIRERASLYLKVRALSSEGRISALMLSVLPVLTFIVLFLVNPAFYLDVATDPMFTKGFVGLLGLYTVGILWIRRMVDLKV